MPQQQALFLTALNGDWVVRSKDIPKPSPEQLLIKVESAALNPLDWMIRIHGIYVHTFPAVLGVEAAGTVEEVGTDVTGFSKGDRVFFQGSYTDDEATFQQYLVVLASTVGKIPANISTDAAASIPVGAGTAHTGLYGDRFDSTAKRLIAPWNEGGATLYKGKPLVVLGGSSSVGQYVIQFAKLSGFSPIIATASSRNAELLKSLGATHVVDRNSDVVAEVKEITGLPVEFVFDAISEGGTQEQGWEIVAPGGTLAVTLPPTINKETYPEKHVYQISAAISQHNELREAYSTIFPKLFAEGLLRPNKVEVINGGLVGVEAGLKRLQEYKVSGYKLVVNPHEVAETSS